MFSKFFDKIIKLVGDSRLERFITLISFIILILSITDIIFTWTVDEKPYGWETSIGLIGILVPILLELIKRIYINRKINLNIVPEEFKDCLLQCKIQKND